MPMSVPPMVVILDVTAAPAAENLLGSVQVAAMPYGKDGDIVEVAELTKRGDHFGHRLPHRVAVLTGTHRTFPTWFA